MFGFNLINTLSGLLIITSLIVIETRSLRRSAYYYAVQSIVLVLIFLTLAVTTGQKQLFLWAASALVTKAILTPYILLRGEDRVASAAPPPQAVRPALAIVLAAISVVVSFVVINQLDLKIANEYKPALAVSVAHFFFGQLCILTQRNILKQILGFCLMENGSHLTLALLAYSAPELVEIGIATDAIFGVLIMTILAVQIYRKLDTLDAASLTSLKG
ncbi:MAG: hydrogenase 4 membrane subunit [Anaerolineae bacterium UTCFX2]|jgi:hydrogenase-4 component E|nr:hydrogenase 4 membrane subunit [Anaerolineales bacterium]OQY87971.1 MAG: hydrogenase 4 membrane subunit [Anaerolineae bacterium UTCFX2]